jgi:hypothetical protein
MVTLAVVSLAADVLTVVSLTVVTLGMVTLAVIPLTVVSLTVVTLAVVSLAPAVTLAPAVAVAVVVAVLQSAVAVAEVALVTPASERAAKAVTAAAATMPVAGTPVSADFNIDWRVLMAIAVRDVVLLRQDTGILVLPEEEIATEYSDGKLTFSKRVSDPIIMNSLGGAFAAHSFLAAALSSLWIVSSGLLVRAMSVPS